MPKAISSTFQTAGLPAREMGVVRVLSAVVVVVSSFLAGHDRKSRQQKTQTLTRRRGDA